MVIAWLVALGNASHDDARVQVAVADESYREVASTVDLEALTDAVEREFGTTHVHSLTFGADTMEGRERVTVVVPRNGATGQAYVSEWDSGSGEWSDRTETTAQGELLDLEDVSDVDLVRIESDAWASLDFVEGVEVEVRADSFEGHPVCVTTTAGGDGADAVLRYDCDGNSV